MNTVYSQHLDKAVRARLRQWPHDTPGLAGDSTAWLRGRPDYLTPQCFLKQPGSDRHRTLPDGLWLGFGGTPTDPYVDIFAIEACGNNSNLLDKRSRFAPSTQSVMAVCPLGWLMAPVIAGGTELRWQATGLLTAQPSAPLVLPVRDMRVMYGLQARHYSRFMEHQVPHPHEFFVPIEALMVENGDQDPAMQALVSRVSARANFFAGTTAA